MSKQARKLHRLERRQQEKNPDRTVVKRILIWGSVVVATVLFLVLLVKISSSPRPAPGERVVPEVTAQDHVRDDLNAGVTLIEYSDFQCPACGQYFGLLKQLHAETGDRIRFVYRHFPLRSVHPNAQIAAQASEAADLQGKFWEMHDFLFEHQDEWSKSGDPEKLFEGYARQLGLDAPRFGADLTSDAVKEKVDAAYDSSVALALDHTPTFFINGKEIPNPSNYGELKDKLLAALEQGR